MDSNIWHPFGPLQGREQMLVEKGAGAYLYLEGGRELVDGISSWWVNLHGHSHPVIARAIADQALLLEQVIFAGFTHTPALQLSQNLLSVLPKDQQRLFFSDDGSTSTEVAIKLALQYWYNQGKPRKKIIALDGAYHGDTFGAMSVGDRSLWTVPFNDLLFEVHQIPFPEDETAAVQAMRAICDSDTAAFIFEPLCQGASGMRIYRPEILDQLINIAREQGVICIADEVMTGFYRTGKFFACDYLENDPDMFCLSKGLTGGFLPMGITCVNERVVAAFDHDDLNQAFWHGHSYTANPLACAAANASFELLIEEACQANIQRISQKHSAFLHEIGQHHKVQHANSLGTVLAVNYQSTHQGYTADIRGRLYAHFLSHDLLLRPLGNIAYVLPPYVISDTDLDRIYAAMLAFH